MPWFLLPPPWPATQFRLKKVHISLVDKYMRSLINAISREAYAHVKNIDKRLQANGNADKVSCRKVNRFSMCEKLFGSFSSWDFGLR